MDLGVTKQQLADMVYQAVDANGMHDASGAWCMRRLMQMVSAALKNILLPLCNGHRVDHPYCCAAGVHIRLMVTRGLKPTPYQVR
jgi:hypothetical protein